MKIDKNKKVEVYFNLHKKCWSIRQAGKPVVHSDFVEIKQPQFVVQQGGNARVRREKRKNVHAFVRGYITKGLKIMGTDKPICNAEYAVLDINNKRPFVEALWY